MCCPSPPPGPVPVPRPSQRCWPSFGGSGRMFATCLLWCPHLWFSLLQKPTSHNHGNGCAVPDGPEQPHSGPPCTPLPTGAPVQLPRPVSGCLAGHLYSLLPPKSWLMRWTAWKDQKRTILAWFVWSWKFGGRAGLPVFSFPSLLFIHLQNVLPLFQRVTKEEGKVTPRWRRVT